MQTFILINRFQPDAWQRNEFWMTASRPQRAIHYTTIPSMLTTQSGHKFQQPQPIAGSQCTGSLTNMEPPDGQNYPLVKCFDRVCLTRLDSVAAAAATAVMVQIHLCNNLFIHANKSNLVEQRLCLQTRDPCRQMSYTLGTVILFPIVRVCSDRSFVQFVKRALITVIISWHGRGIVSRSWSLFVVFNFAHTISCLTSAISICSLWIFYTAYSLSGCLVLYTCLNMCTNQ